VNIFLIVLEVPAKYKKNIRIVGKELDILPTQSLCSFVQKTMSKIGSMHIFEIYCQ
jgi:hypothetical protein